MFTLSPSWVMRGRLAKYPMHSLHMLEYPFETKMWVAVNMLASSLWKKKRRVGLVAEEISNGIQSILFLNLWFKSSLGQYREQKSLHFNGTFEYFLSYRRCIRCIEDVFSHRYPQRAFTGGRLPHSQGNKLMVSQYLLRRS